MSFTETSPTTSPLDGLSMTASTARTTENTQSSWNGHTNGKSKPLDLLGERAKTHGSFQQTARIAQALKDVMRSSPNWETASPVRRECWEMIATKLARQLSGDPEHPDHQDDIDGYEALANR
jgi:hypothetical protein